MSNLINIGVEKGFISLDADQNNIVYTVQGRCLRYNDTNTLREDVKRQVAIYYGLETEETAA